jgi:uncharacterized Zn finger protein (UPF0148 family)
MLDRCTSLKCQLLTQENSIYCPRHTFLHNIVAQEERDKETAKADAKKQRQDSAPKTRGELLKQGYEHIDNAACHGCHKAIEWWKTPNAKRAPYDPMPEFESPAVSHFATCKHAVDFRRAG